MVLPGLEVNIHLDTFKISIINFYSIIIYNLIFDLFLTSNWIVSVWFFIYIYIYIYIYIFILLNSIEFIIRVTSLDN